MRVRFLSFVEYRVVVLDNFNQGKYYAYEHVFVVKNQQKRVHMGCYGLISVKFPTI